MNMIAKRRRGMWFALAGAIFLGAFGQILMKEGMKAMGAVPTDQGVMELALYFIRVFLSPYIMAAVFSYVVGLFLWLGVLSMADLSLIRPIMSAGYLITMTYGIWAGENVTTGRIFGTILIVIGLYFVVRSGFDE